MTNCTPKEIKNRLSNIGETIGSIALEYIAELEKENEQLKQENAELKEKLKTEDCIEYLAKGGYVKFLCENGNEHDQLTKLKGIVKRFLEFVNNEVEYDPENPEVHTKMWNELCEEAEQFLKDSEVKNDR